MVDKVIENIVVTGQRGTGSSGFGGFNGTPGFGGGPGGNFTGNAPEEGGGGGLDPRIFKFLRAMLGQGFGSLGGGGGGGDSALVSMMLQVQQQIEEKRIKDELAARQRPSPQQAPRQRVGGIRRF